MDRDPSDGRPRILLVTPHLIYPALSGGELRIYALLRCLAARYRVSLLTFLEPGAKARSMAAALSLEQDLVHRVHFVEWKAAGSEAWMPPEAQHWQSSEMRAAIQAIVSEESTQLVHLEFSELAQYARGLRGRVPVVLTEHDASALSWKSSYLPPARGWNTLGRPWALARQWLYAWRAFEDCDRVVAVSEADRSRLRALLPESRIEVIPTGVDLSRFPARGADGRRDGTLVFVGHYPHFPNEDAAVYFAREIFPRVLERAPSARLQLVGSGPTPAVRALASASIEVTGTVPEVQPYLAAGQVFVAPLRLGFGIKGKVLEAFASGIPVVATPQACEGIPQAKHGEHLLIGGSAESFAGHIRRLLEDPASGRKLAASARTLVEQSYSWDFQADRLDALYRSLLKRPSSRNGSSKMAPALGGTHVSR